MLLTPPVRPSVSIERFVWHIRHLGIERQLKMRQRIHPAHEKTPCLYLFTKGEVSTLRGSDGLLLSTACEPHISGITKLFSLQECIILRAETDCHFIRVDTMLALMKIKTDNLWYDVANILSYQLNSMLYRDMQIVNRRSMSVVWHYLHELDSYSMESQRQVNILNYISERTGLSRSSILNTIRGLKAQGMIEYSRGGYNLRILSKPSPTVMQAW